MLDKIANKRFKPDSQTELEGIPIRNFKLRIQRTKNTIELNRNNKKIVLSDTLISTNARAMINNQLRKFLYHSIWPKKARLYEKCPCFPKFMNLLVVNNNHNTNKKIPIYFHQFICPPTLSILTSYS
ncbi:hypothetical protein FD11_GL000118 [Ligilactobacillus pobuzihii E100301 = KCTC 13174]|uniref:Uncharacterized protein n=1 Tax=Ligilactobacillus pobuzihii TaxID=449659 RepID=A0A0R2LLM0_9LACO|nr:hypothetical protein FD11_GL000118 [Ligilactobacillus pobuzihii E100301 = KCTC 13174]KRO02692.1 hypothetical protein IV66_GL000118 [Ligilactobacillus pobuzihii]